ncbi:hypothetical protein DFH09DRAFT_1435827 [Mycena vulgaris]|nr:hypothetical protein DFH09DRAFT_1435827 [Mycena vulgaris]
MRLMAEIHGQIEPFALHPRGLHTLTALVQRTNLRPTSRTPRAFHHRRAPRLALAGSVISCALSTTAVVLVGLPRLGPSPCTVSHRRSARSAPAASRRALADLPSAQIDVLRAACLPGALCLHGAVVPPASPAPRCRRASTRAASALRYTHSALEYPLLLPDPALAFLPLPPLRGATPAFASAPRDPTARPAPAHAIALANVHLASHARIYARGRPLHAPRAQLPLGSLEIGARATPCPTSPKIGASHLSTRQGRFPRGCEGDDLFGCSPPCQRPRVRRVVVSLRVGDTPPQIRVFRRPRRVESASARVAVPAARRDPRTSHSGPGARWPPLCPASDDDAGSSSHRAVTPCLKPVHRDPRPPMCAGARTSQHATQHTLPVRPTSYRAREHDVAQTPTLHRTPGADWTLPIRLRIPRHQPGTLRATSPPERRPRLHASMLRVQMGARLPLLMLPPHHAPPRRALAVALVAREGGSGADVT